jgi:hypothetical protein
MGHSSTEGVFGAFDPSRLLIEEPQIVFHKADQPDFVADLADPDLLTCEHLAQVDLAFADADAPTGGDHDGSVMQRVLEFAEEVWPPSSIKAASLCASSAARS